MECSDGIAPFVKQDPFWKHDNSNSDELELDFEADLKENSDSKTDDSDDDSLTFTSARNGEKFYRNDANPTRTVVDSTHDETVVTSTNEKPEGRPSTVPTGLLLYRLFNQIIIDALLSTNSNAIANNDEIDGSENSFNDNVKVDSISSTREWVDKHYPIFKSSTLGNDTAVENIVAGGCFGNDGRNSAVENVLPSAINEPGDVNEGIDRNHLGFAGNSLERSSKMDVIDKNVELRTACTQFNTETSNIEHNNSFPTTNQSNNTCLSIQRVSIRADNCITSIINNNNMERAVATHQGTQSIVTANMPDGVTGSSKLNANDACDNDVEAIKNTCNSSVAPVNTNELCENFHDGMKSEDMIIDEILKGNYKNLVQNDIIVCGNLGEERSVRGSMSDFLSNDEDAGITDQCSSIRSGDTDSQICDDLDSSSVTTIKSIPVSDCENFVKRRSIIDDKIINNVFECFKRKLIETINNEIIHSLNARRRESIDTNDNDVIANESDCDNVRDALTSENRCNNGVLSICDNADRDGNILCDKTPNPIDNVHNLNAIISKPIESFRSNINVNDMRNFHCNVNISEPDSNLRSDCKSNNLNLMNVNNQEASEINHNMSCDSIEIVESLIQPSALKRKLSSLNKPVSACKRSGSVDYVNCSITDSNENQIIKKMKIDSLDLNASGNTDEKQNLGNSVDVDIRKEYSCRNCKTNRKFLYGMSCVKRQYRNGDCDILKNNCNKNFCSSILRNFFLEDLSTDPNGSKPCGNSTEIKDNLYELDGFKSTAEKRYVCDKMCNDLNVCKNHKIYCRNKNYDCNLKLRYKNDSKSSGDFGKTSSHQYLCSVCGVSLHGGESFNEHLESHTYDGEISNKLHYIICQICNKRYYMDGVYAEHIEVDHKKCSCKFCNKLLDSNPGICAHEACDCFSDEDCLTQNCPDVLCEHSYSRNVDDCCDVAKEIGSDVRVENKSEKSYLEI